MDLNWMPRSQNWRELARAALAEPDDARALEQLARALELPLRRRAVPTAAIKRLWTAARAAGYGLKDLT